MREFILTLSTILTLALPLAAQETAAQVDLTIENSQRGCKFMPMGNSVNNNIILFYEAVSGVETDLKARTVGPTGDLGPVRILAQTIDYQIWDVVWHPVVKKFMLVYRKNNDVWARRIKLNAKPGGSPKKVCDYHDNYLEVAWTKKKKYILFMARSGQLTAQALKKNGKKYRTEEYLTSFTSGEAYPVAADTKVNGEAVAYFAHYDSTPNWLTPRLISVDHKLTVHDDYAITTPQDSGSKATFVGKYDPAFRIHSVAWRLAASEAKKVHSKYCCFYESGAMVQPPTNTPVNIIPKALLYDPAAKRFAVWYNKYNVFNSLGFQPTKIDNTHIFLMVYNPNGVIVAEDLYVYMSHSEDEGSGVGFAKNGNILGVISPKRIALCIYARLIY